MSETPDYNGFDPRRAKGERMTIQSILEKFMSEMPPGTRAYNLGSGQRPMDGMVNVDYEDAEGVDVVADLFGTGWPIEDGSAGLIWMSHFAEHIPSSVWPNFWLEMWRICADNARVVIMGPHHKSNRYYQDYTHCQPLLDEKFAYFQRQWRVDNKLDHSRAYPDVNFIMEFNTVDSWHPRLTPYTDEAKQEAKLIEWNAITDSVWFLKALKSSESEQAYMNKLAKDAQA